MKRVLVADKLSEVGVKILKARPDIEVTVRSGLSKDELKQIIGGFDGVIVRSATKLTADILARARSLKVIARAGVGVDNVDVEAATKQGILVLNTPEGNTIATCELTFAMLLSLARELPQLDQSVKHGEWRRGILGTELFGKTLGIIGLGRIGSELARRARVFGMTVLAHDPYVSPERAANLGVQLVSFRKLLRTSDFISVHTPLSAETRALIGRKEFALMKRGVRLVNCARGGIIDEQALKAAIRSGKVAGCALDVLEQEPPTDQELVSLPQVICSPHIGASTEEAQENVARQAAEQMIAALDGRAVRNAVNAPALSPELAERFAPFLVLAEKLGMLLVQLAGTCPDRVKLTTFGGLNAAGPLPVANFFVAGMLTHVLTERVNYINAPLIARERGIKVETVRSEEEVDFSDLLSAEAIARKPIKLAGTIFATEPRIVQIGNYHVDITPFGDILVCYNHDKPGVIKHLSTILADSQINIADMTVGRDRPGGTALTAIRVDTQVPEPVLEEIRKSSLIIDAKSIKL